MRSLALALLAAVALPAAAQEASTLVDVDGERHAFVHRAYTTTALNVRSGPSTSDSVLTTLPRGTYVAHKTCRGRWCPVLLPAGPAGPAAIGYASEDYLSDRDPAAEPVRSAAPNYRTTRSTGRSVAVQCSGVTQKGNRCRRRTTNASGRCYQH